MAINERLREQIERLGIHYQMLRHPAEYTAQRVAQSTHVPGRLVAKPVILREADGTYSMAVVTAGQHVDVTSIPHVRAGARASLADELELARLFPDCEVGAMPPVGRLYGLPTYIDDEFRRHPDIYFQAGNHRELVHMKFADFVKLAGPFAGEFSLHREPSKIGAWGVE
jgi:Ala-tRNA(Pro) deacylase